MKGKKTIFDKFKLSWEGGQTLVDTYPKISFYIRNSCLNQINAFYQNSKGEIPQDEKMKLIGMITEVKEERKKLGEDTKCTVEEYQEFLNNYFHEVEQEDLHQTVTMKTAYKFRLMSEFIQILTEFEPLNDEIKKLQKYCKFKTVDITKSLKKGEVPKRGGQKEEDSGGIDQELEDMSLKQVKENEQQQEKGNLGGFPKNNMMNNDPNQQFPPNPNPNPYMPNAQYDPHGNNQNFNEYQINKLASSERSNRGNYLNNPASGPNDLNNPNLLNSYHFSQRPNQYNQQGFQQPSQFNQQGFQQPPQFNQQGFQQPPQFNQQGFQQPPQTKPQVFPQQPPQTKPQVFPQQPPQTKPQVFPQQPPQTKPTGPQQPPQNKPTGPQQPPQNKPTGPQQPPQNKPTGPQQQKPDASPKKERGTKEKNEIIIDPNDPNKRLITSKGTQLTIKLPLKQKTMDYYKLIDVIKKNNEVAFKEIKKGNTTDALELVENSLQFMNLIN